MNYYIIALFLSFIPLKFLFTFYLLEWEKIAKIYIKTIHHSINELNHKYIWNRYMIFVKNNPDYLKNIGGEKEREYVILMRKMFWFFQINYLKILDGNVIMLYKELFDYRQKIKDVENVPLSSFMNIHKYYKELTSVEDEQFIPSLIKYLDGKPHGFIDKLGVLYSSSEKKNNIIVDKWKSE